MVWTRDQNGRAKQSLNSFEKEKMQAKETRQQKRGV